MYTSPVSTEYTESASVYISKISKLLTRIVLFIANYAWYLANTMYLLMIGERFWIITLSTIMLDEGDVRSYWFYA